MIAPARRLPRLDKILIGIVTALAIASVVSSELEDRAYYRWRKTRPLAISKQPESRWPAWLQEWKRPARRRLQAIKSGLVAASLGLTFVAFRPGRIARPRRWGPGYVAVAIVGGLSAVSVFYYIYRQWAEPLLTGQGPFYEPGEPMLPWTYITESVNSVITWALVPAWVYLAATGHWRRPLDPLDRMGRRLGWAWIVILAVNWFVQQIPVG